ncbi:hypothetical protein HanIR_Chr05g0229031 [Helianthus annuus]|nr:hypothetical protein HanIR_Chr05g0229031 [Helianthus annuus]
MYRVSTLPHSLSFSTPPTHHHQYLLLSPPPPRHATTHSSLATTHLSHTHSLSSSLSLHSSTKLPLVTTTCHHPLHHLPITGSCAKI